jgi:site-specific recombinase XerD
VFSSVGTPLDAANVRRSFRCITKAAGLGTNWTPRELRHSFVSIMSDNGVTTEQIADLVGHRTTIVTQKVGRGRLKPIISTGATAMNTLFGNEKTAQRPAKRLAPVSAPDDRR